MYVHLSAYLAYTDPRIRHIYSIKNVQHKGVSKETPPRISVDTAPDPDIDPDDPNLTIPLTRYNAMLAVLRNTVFMYV